jgi:segregation and condensation protein A
MSSYLDLLQRQVKLNSSQLSSTFTIKLPVFEGPFDLLLFFIERDELDIYNIPIAKITDDFLGYLHQLEALSIDLASEFIVVAATLMRIKAKMLLPRKQIDDEGNEIDPRHELVERLLEYKRYKSVLEDLRRLEEVRSFMNPRGFATAELRKLADQALADAELESVSLYKLLRVFERLLNRFEEDKKAKRIHTVYNYNYTIQQQREYLKSTIKKGEKTDFELIFAPLENRIHAIVTFLALLELLNAQEIALIQGEGVNNFWLTLPE